VVRALARDPHPSLGTVLHLVADGRHRELVGATLGADANGPADRVAAAYTRLVEAAILAAAVNSGALPRCTARGTRPGAAPATGIRRGCTAVVLAAPLSHETVSPGQHAQGVPCSARSQVATIRP
jgi:hypothetical protein